MIIRRRSTGLISIYRFPNRWRVRYRQDQWVGAGRAEGRRGSLFTSPGDFVIGGCKTVAGDLEVPTAASGRLKGAAALKVSSVCGTHGFTSNNPSSAAPRFSSRTGFPEAISPVLSPPVSRGLLSWGTGFPDANRSLCRNRSFTDAIPNCRAGLTSKLRSNSRCINMKSN